MNLVENYFKDKNQIKKDGDIKYNDKSRIIHLIHSSETSLKNLKYLLLIWGLLISVLFIINPYIASEASELSNSLFPENNLNQIFSDIFSLSLFLHFVLYLKYFILFFISGLVIRILEEGSVVFDKIFFYWCLFWNFVYFISLSLVFVNIDINGLSLYTIIIGFLMIVTLVLVIMSLVILSEIYDDLKNDLLMTKKKRLSEISYLKDKMNRSQDELDFLYDKIKITKNEILSDEESMAIIFKLKHDSDFKDSYEDKLGEISDGEIESFFISLKSNELTKKDKDYLLIQEHFNKNEVENY